MRYLGLLRGLPGAGKSYFIKEHNLEACTLSSDDYRLKLSNPTFNIDGDLVINQKVSGQAWKNLRRDLEYRMGNGEFTLIDATNISKKEVLSYRTLCRKYFYHLFIIDFTTISVDKCKQNNINRDFRKVPEEVIDKMAKKLETEIIPSSIKSIYPNEYETFINSIYNPIDFSNYNAVHVIGDIHGCYEPLMKRFEDINMDTDAVIFVGDYFDRGLQNVEVFKFLYDIKDRENVFMCIGNHEERIFKYLRGEDVSHTQFYEKTLKQFKEAGITDKMLKYFCHSLITCAYFEYNAEHYIVSHGGLSYSSVSPYAADSIFVYGVGSYEDMETVCKSWDNCEIDIQIFGHRNNKDVPIKINDTCYNVCGFPEYGGDLKSVKIVNDDIVESYITNTVIDDAQRYRAIEKYPDRFNIDVPDAINLFRHSKFVKENTFGNISSFNFNKDAFYDDIWNGATVKARGIFINTKTEKIVARSYDKFFLLDQHECSTIDKFEFPLTCYIKYDGFLGILGYDEETDDLVFCSKSMKAPEGEYAQWFKEELEKKIVNRNDLIAVMKARKVSLVFEVILPDKDEHIIKYNKSQIILLDMVKNTIDFKMFSYDITKRIGGMYFKDLKYKFYTASIADKDTFMKEITKFKKVTNIEGFVFVDVNNKMFKLKTYAYELGKLTRNQYEYYDNIYNKISGNTAVLKYPDKQGFIAKYQNFYQQDVINKLYDNTIDVINKFNAKIKERVD